MSIVQVDQQLPPMEEIGLRRQDVSSRLDAGRRSEFGQFFTSASVAGLMAGMAEAQTSSYRVLDAGAGIGSLSAALVDELCTRTVRPHDLRLTAFEIDPFLQPYLRETLARCQATAASADIECVVSVEAQDFIRAGVAMIRGGMFDPQRQVFDCAILNPPYHKIRSDSDARLLLRSVGIETSNLYTAFVALAVELLVPGGELIAITPRSFCNGPYFRPFRESLLREMRMRRLHIFESRETAFSDDAVLQENVILHAVKCPPDEPPRPVWITSSVGPGDDLLTTRQAPYDRVIRPGDPDFFIHIVPNELGQAVADCMLALTARLTDLGITVSTGRVVDFRARAFLRTDPEPGSVPLIYPTHLLQGGIAWPKQSRKPNALLLDEATRDLYSACWHLCAGEAIHLQGGATACCRCSLRLSDSCARFRSLRKSSELLSRGWQRPRSRSGSRIGCISQQHDGGWLLPPVQRSHAGQRYRSTQPSLPAAPRAGAAGPTRRSRSRRSGTRRQRSMRGTPPHGR